MRSEWRLCRSVIAGLAACCVLLANPSWSDEPILLRGQVHDPLGNPLPGAVVEIRHGAAVKPLRLLRCDQSGAFLATLQPGEYHLRATRVDCIAWEATLSLHGKDRQLLIVLRERTLMTPPVRVSASRHDAARQSNGVTLRQEDLGHKVGGLEDVMRSVQDLPGVSAPSDLHAEMYVRGSDTSANAVYLDGIEIMFPYHILGFNSVLSPGLVEKADFYATNAPLAYSGATGGVLVVESRGGRPLPPAGNVGLSWLSGYAQATVGTDRHGLAFSMRRSYHDKLAQLLGEVENQQIPTFHEVHLRGSWIPRPGHLLTAGMLWAGDGMSIPSPELQAQNYSLLQAEGDAESAAAVRASSVQTRGGRLSVDNRVKVFSVQHSTDPAPRVHLQTTLGWVPQYFDFSLNRLDHQRATAKSSVVTLQQLVRWTGSQQSVQFGWRLYRDMTERRVVANAGLLQLRQPNTSLHLHDQHERYDYHTRRLRGAAMFHATHTWQPRAWPWELESGLRFEHDTLTGDTAVDPRFALTWRVAPAWRMVATWGTAHTLRDKFVEVAPTLSGAPLRAEMAQTRTLEIEGRIEQWTLGSTAWTKTSRNLVYESSPAYYSNGATSKAHGVDSWLQWKAPHRGWSSRLQYSWSRTLQRNPIMFRRNVLPGATSLAPRQPLYESSYWFEPEQDLRHQLSWHLQLARGGWEFGSQLHVQSGRAWTPVESAVLDARNWPVGVEARRGSARLPGYVRWDLRFARQFQSGRAAWNIYAEILNVTRARNVFQYRYDAHYQNLVAVMMLPTLPTLGFEARF